MPLVTAVRAGQMADHLPDLVGLFVERRAKAAERRR
jgi:hypothetical protein